MTTSSVRPLRPLEIAVAPYRDDATTAMTGTFMYEGNCLLFRNEDSRQLFRAIWPAGTVFNGTSIIFHLPGKADARVVLAEEVHISGRAFDWASLDPAYATPFRQQCAATPFFVSAVRPAN